MCLVDMMVCDKTCQNTREMRGEKKGVEIHFLNHVIKFLDVENPVNILAKKRRKLFASGIRECYTY